MLSIIIPARNESDNLEDILNYLKKNSIANSVEKDNGFPLGIDLDCVTPEEIEAERTALVCTIIPPTLHNGSSETSVHFSSRLASNATCSKFNLLPFLISKKVSNPGFIMVILFPYPTIVTLP